MTTPIGPRTNSLYHASELAAGSVFSAGRGVVVVLASIAAFVVASTVVMTLGGGLTLAVIAGEVALVAVPLAFVVGKTPRGSLAMIGLRRPEARFVAAALLIGASQWILNLVVASQIDSALDLGDSGQRIQAAVEQPPLVLALIAIALAPAIAEEVLFRGVLARALASRFIAPIAILASAVVFSLFHLSPVQAAPTFLLGLVYGYVALVSRSAVPTMIAHLANNTIAILVARSEIPWLFRALENHLKIALLASVLLTATGIAIASRRTR